MTAIQTTRATFQINNATFYVPVVALFINDNAKFSENLKQGFKRKISWNKYIFGITVQSKNKNLDYLIGQTFRNSHRLFVLSFKNGTHDPTRDTFHKHCKPCSFYLV